MYTIIFAIKCGVHGGLNGAVKHGSHQEMFLGKVILFSYLSEFNQVYDELQLLKTWSYGITQLERNYKKTLNNNNNKKKKYQLQNFAF